MYKVKKNYFVLVFFMVCAINPYGLLAQYSINNDWLVLDKESNTYVPYLKENSSAKSIYKWINKQDFRLGVLTFTAHPGLSLYLNGELIYYNNTKSVQQPKVNPLPDIFSESELQLISFYSPRGIFPKDFKLESVEANTITTGRQGKILERSRNTISDYIIILFLATVFVAAFFKSKAPRRFFEVFSLSDNINVGSDTNSQSQIFSLSVLLMIIINVFSFSIYAAAFSGGKIFFNHFFGLQISDNKPFTQMVFLTLFFAAFFILKFVFVFFLGWAFKVTKIVFPQFYLLLTIFMKINVFALPVVLAAFSINNFSPISGSIWFIIIVLLGLVYMLYRATFLIFTISSFRNLYLFSYLCVSEILPVFIILKVMLFDVS